MRGAEAKEAEQRDLGLGLGENIIRLSSPVEITAIKILYIKQIKIEIEFCFF